MTQLSLTFVIDNAKSTIHLFSVSAPLAPNSFASNISFVQWGNGAGIVLYSDRLALPEVFTDPSPYQIAVNQWMTAKASLLVTPLTLAQAQAIKNSLIDGVYAYKRQSPLTVSTSQGSLTFSMDDQYGVLQAPGAIPIAQILLGGMGSIETMVQGVVSSYNTAAANDAYYNESEMFAGLSIATTGNSWTDYLSIHAYGISASSPALPAITTTPVLLPIGATSYPPFTTADQLAIINAAVAQKSREQLIWSQKRAAVNALTSVASVVAYDTTTGW
jgi:hypothetical protein